MAFAQGHPSDLSTQWGSNFEYKVLSYYLGVHRVPCMINSPLRIDSNPSFQISSSGKGHVRWMDFGTGDSGTLWSLLAKLWNVSVKKAEQRVASETPKILAHEHNVEVTYTTSVRGKVIHSESTDLQVKVRPWKPHDLEYWQSQGISEEWLNFGDIYPISHILLTKNSFTNIIPAEKYAYAFVEYKDNTPTLKIYQPFSKKFKWTNKHDRSVWDLWTKLPETGDTLIITSSRKDALCIWANTGIPSVSLQGEGYIPKAHVVDILLKRFKKVYILYDNDFRSELNYGREFGKKLADTFGLEQIEIPTMYHSKDPSDLYHNHGGKKLQQVIFDLTKKQNQGEDDCPF